MLEFLSQSSLDNTVYEITYNDIVQLREENEKEPIVIGSNASYTLDKRHERLIEKTYQEFSLEWTYGIKPVTRLVYLP